MYPSVLACEQAPRRSTANCTGSCTGRSRTRAGRRWRGHRRPRQRPRRLVRVALGRQWRWKSRYDRRRRGQVQGGAVGGIRAGTGPPEGHRRARRLRGQGQAIGSRAHPQSAGEPVFTWLMLFGECAAEAGIDPRAGFEAAESAALPQLVRMIEASPRVRLVDGKAPPPAGDAGGAPRLRPPPRASPPLCAGDIALKWSVAAAGGKGRGGGLARVAGRVASPPRTARRRPTPEEIAAYHRDANTYFALLAFYGVAKRTDAAPPSVELALQRFLCAMPGGCGDSHPVRTRYENAMPCLFYYTQVKGMPPTTTTRRGSRATSRSGTWTHPSSSRVFKAWRWRRERWRSAPTPGTAACRREGRDIRRCRP